MAQVMEQTALRRCGPLEIDQFADALRLANKGCEDIHNRLAVEARNDDHTGMDRAAVAPEKLSGMIKRRLVPLTLLVAVLGGLGFLALRRTEPFYQGKALGVWIAELQYGRYGDHAMEDEARKALRAMGEIAVPNLIATLQRTDSRLKEAINNLSQSSPLDRRLFPSRIFYRLAAAGALGEIGPPASDGIPVLIQASKQDNV